MSREVDEQHVVLTHDCRNTRPQEPPHLANRGIGIGHDRDVVARITVANQRLLDGLDAGDVLRNIRYAAGLVVTNADEQRVAIRLLDSGSLDHGSGFGLWFWSGFGFDLRFRTRFRFGLRLWSGLRLGLRVRLRCWFRLWSRLRFGAGLWLGLGGRLGA